MSPDAHRQDAEPNGLSTENLSKRYGAYLALAEVTAASSESSAGAT